MSNSSDKAPDYRGLPSPCWQVCNKAYQQARLFDTYPEYCKPESAYQSSFSNCQVCCSTNQTNDIHQAAANINATLVSIFGEFTNRCNDFNSTSKSNATNTEQPEANSGFTLAHIIGTVLTVMGGILLIACIVTAYRNRSRDKVERARLLQQTVEEEKRRVIKSHDLESQPPLTNVDKFPTTETEVSPMMREIDGNPRIEMEVEERTCELDLDGGYREMDVQLRIRRA
ncbi:hypothetical protein QBC40DRAFT_173064 [Triangularia verruculosa]|uniref:Uncharacterized protein n=1 Tax=Triangularia verruculosa TaxID=2587418 RepID=A0AAN6XIB7_9PEZI|nr:hypothetical protein QBC40DRAFT_173064 [Triangularia verruculosa]